MPYKKNLEFTPLMTLRHLSFILLLLVLFTPAQAEEPASGFDHFSTGFPLIGRHEVIDCSECHIAGQFKGTPMVCGLCHNNIRAPGKHPQHVLSSNVCDDCHTERTWLGAKYDHIGIAGSCVTCHNNSIAIGKSASHILTTDICEDCHNTISFDRVARVDHASVIGVCSSCHNGFIATGMHSTHIPLTSTITSECDECHTTNTWFTRFDHALVVGNCSSCHNGIFATGKNADHEDTNDDCLDCHTTEAWLPATDD